MPARFVYWMNVSLDLRIERELDEQGGGDWLTITDELHREFNARAAAMTCMISGRKFHETMEGYWPDARHDDSLSAVTREYGDIWTSKPKVLVSRTRTMADYNTRIFGGDTAIDDLAALRDEGDGDMWVGGATLGTQVLTAGMLDEVLLFTHPVILDGGRPLFDNLETPLELELLEQQVFPGDVTLHRYAVQTLIR